MAGGIGRLRIRSSSAVFEEQRAPGAEKLTARPLEVVAASGRAPKRVVDGGGNV